MATLPSTDGVDPVTIIALIAAAGVAAAGYTIHHLRQQMIAREARAEEVWALLAKNYGLTYTHVVVHDDRIVERQCSGTQGGLSVRVEQGTSSVDNARITTIRVAIDGWPYPKLRIHRASEAHVATSPTGDRSFDAVGAMQSPDVEFAAAVVTPDVRAAFVDLWQFAGDATFQDGKLTWRTPGVVSELKALDGTLHRALVAMRLLRAGTAGPGDSDESVADERSGLYTPPQ